MSPDPTIRSTQGDDPMHAPIQRNATDTTGSSSPSTSHGMPSTTDAEDDASVECGAKHPDDPSVACKILRSKFHTHHMLPRGIVEGGAVFWENEPANRLWDAFAKQRYPKTRRTLTFEAFQTRWQEEEAAAAARREIDADIRTLQRSVEHDEDPRPAWIAHAVSMISQVAHERERFSEADVWPRCAYPTGRAGGAGLMGRAFAEATAAGICTIVRHDDGSVKARHRDDQAVVSLDGSKVRLPEVFAIMQSLIPVADRNRGRR